MSVEKKGRIRRNKRRSKSKSKYYSLLQKTFNINIAEKYETSKKIHTHYKILLHCCSHHCHLHSVSNCKSNPYSFIYPFKQMFAAMASVLEWRHILKNKYCGASSRVFPIHHNLCWSWLCVRDRFLNSFVKIKQF